MKNKISSRSFCRADYAVCKVVGGKGLILNLISGAYFEVNPVGLAIWKLCDGKLGTDRIALRISRRLAADIIKVQKDVKVYVDSLKRARLLKLLPKPVQTAR